MFGCRDRMQHPMKPANWLIWGALALTYSAYSLNDTCNMYVYIYIYKYCTILCLYKYGG